MSTRAAGFKGNKAALPTKSCVTCGRPMSRRHLVVVLGDQLDAGAGAVAFDGFDAAQDFAWMAEVAEESTQVWSTQPQGPGMLAGPPRFEPDDGDDACPFTTLYWDFLARMVRQVRNLARLSASQRSTIAEREAAVRRGELA